MDDYQTHATNAFNTRNHVAILGAAGTGKSHVLIQIVKNAREKFGAKGCVACAWTNNAAKKINGITVHKLFAAKINWEWTEEGLWNQVVSNREVRDFLLDLKVIIVDEFFTIKSNVLDAIDFVLRRLVRVTWHEGLALGGRLLVVSGDPFQLEPIFPKHERRSSTAVDSNLWYHCFGNDAYGIIVILSHNHRQASDPQFYDILSRLRVGRHSTDDLRVLNSTSQFTEVPPDTHTRLVLTHNEASGINERMLDKILGERRVCTAFDKFINVSADETCLVKDRLDQSAPRRIVTKVGARVLLTRTCGEFLPGSEMTVVDVQPYYLDGKTHNALSLICIPYVPTEDQSFNLEPISIIPMRVPIHSISGELIAYREQLPVIPSYAITVHRSQSLSLQRVAIDFRDEVNSRWNPYGKVFVALSRCTNLDGLWVKGLKKGHISVSPSAHRLMRNVDLIHKMIPDRVVRKTQAVTSKSFDLQRKLHVLRDGNVDIIKKRTLEGNKDNRASKQLREDKENYQYGL